MTWWRGRWSRVVTHSSMTRGKAGLLSGLLLFLLLLVSPGPGSLPCLAKERKCNQVPMRFLGNQAILPEVYKALLCLPDSAGADQKTAARVEKELTEFLHRTGYTLARVRVTPEDARLVVVMDEGVIDKVIFSGTDSLNTVRLKLDLALPGGVFNRGLLNRRIKEIRKKYKLKELTWELKELPSPAGSGAGALLLGDVVDQRPLRELHIRIGSSGWSTGFGFDLEYDFPYGLTLGANYRGTDLILGGDRWRTDARVGGTLRNDLITDDTYPAFSLGAAALRWYTPGLGGTGLRPFIWLRWSLETLQRRDLSIENYFSNRVEVSLNLSYEFVSGLEVFTGGGVQSRHVFDITKAGEPGFEIRELDGVTPFLATSMELDFSRGQGRVDRKHRLLGGVRWQQYTSHEDVLTMLWYQYQKVFSLGWDDLKIASQGVWMFGRPAFDDEEPVGGRYLRGVFGSKFYGTRMTNLTLEYRMAIDRDFFKVSVFNDFAIFGEKDRVADTDELTFGDAFGLGAHTLILDTFQLDAYLSFGVTAAGDFDYGAAASFKKVF